MPAKRLLLMGLLTAAFGAGYALGDSETGLVPEASASPSADAQATQVYELRTYTAPDGKLDDLLARFRDHTMRIFEKHGMTNHGYWVPQDPELRQNTLVYILSHDSREAGEASWGAFFEDPEWQRVSEESQRDGRIVAGVERMWLDPTDFSPMK